MSKPNPMSWQLDSEEADMKSRRKINTRKARIYFSDGQVECFANQVFAYTVWLALPPEVRVAFRGVNDTRPVYPWDYVGARGKREKRKKGRQHEQTADQSQSEPEMRVVSKPKAGSV